MLVMHFTIINVELIFKTSKLYIIVYSNNNMNLAIFSVLKSINYIVGISCKATLFN